VKSHFFGHTFQYRYIPSVWDIDTAAMAQDGVPLPRIAETCVSGFDNTKIQVDDVGGGGVVKTDGEFIYVASNGELSIFDGANPEYRSR